jgi:hypothetical protein
VNFIRLFHSSLQGFVSLENAGFFNLDADINESFRILVDSQIMILGSFRRTKIVTVKQKSPKNGKEKSPTI